MSDAVIMGIVTAVTTIALAIISAVRPRTPVHLREPPRRAPAPKE